VKINYSQENLKVYRERLQAALARGEGPDIFRLHQTWVPMLGGYLSPLPASVYDAATFERTFHPVVRETLRWQGQYTAIPLEFDGLALFYNEDLFRASGKTPPRTWGELKKTACELTVKDNQGKIRTAGVALGTTKNVDHWSDILGLMLLQNGANPANPAFCSQESGVGVEGGEVCLGRDALSFYTLFASNQACEDEGLAIGAVWDDLMPTSTYAFATGAVAMYFGSSWETFEIKQLNPNLNFKVVPVPQLEGKNIAWASFWVEGVSKNSKYQAEAWEFLKYLSSKEVMQKLYQTESALRPFGEPYSRVDLAASLNGQPIVGAFMEQAPYAQSWYLASRTGDNGLNDQIIKYYEDAVNAVNEGKDPLTALTTASQGIAQVLRQYGIAK
jgi:multiple sugar transport system substrate-binding protein